MKTFYFSLALLVLGPVFVLASLGDVELGFAPVVDAAVRTTSVQADGRIIIGGDFTFVAATSRNHLARLLADGSLDAAFNPDVDGVVLCAAVQRDEKIIIGGWFGSVGGTTRHNIARLLPNGALDTSFDPDAGDQVQGIVLQPDGRLIIHGRFTSIGGNPAGYVARLQVNGSVDSSFTATPDHWVNTVALQTDGKVIIGGLFNTVGGLPRHGLARLQSDGTLDTSFAAAPDDVVRCIAVQPDGRILVGGWFKTIDGTPRQGLARLSSSGALDSGFDPNSDGSVESMIAQVDGKVVIGGAFEHVASTQRRHLARMNADGSLDAAFNPDADALVTGVALQGDGKIIAAGSFASVGGSGQAFIARLTNDASAQSLSAPSAARLRWIRSGSAPEVLRATFSASADAGVTWTVLGSGLKIAGGWELGGLVLLNNSLVRARAEVPAGSGNGTVSVIESLITVAATDAEISMAVPSLDVNEEAGTVSLTVLRAGPASNTLSVSLSTADGTAAAPGDYAAITAQTITFASGETSKAVPIAIKKDSVSERNETFIVSISSPSSGAVLSPQIATVVRILETDTTSPVVTISAPVINALVAENATGSFTLRGGATDNKGVENVQVSINGAAYADASLTPAGSGGTYMLTAIAVTGTNTIKVRAIDGRGNVSLAVTRSFTYVRKRSLLVNVNPNGSTGAVSGALGGVVYQAGKTYALTATAKPGYVFDHWTVPGLTGVATERTALSFVFNETLAASALPTITAHFVPLPFITSVIGTFNGLIKPDAGEVASNSTTGFFTANVTSTGAFTGTVKIDGISTAISGVLDNTGVARFGSARANTLSLLRTNGRPPLVLSFTVDVTGATHQLTGLLTAFDHSVEISSSIIDAARSYYDGKTIPTSLPASYISTHKGYFTVALPPKPQTNGLTIHDYAQGDGTGWLRITAAGAVTGALAMADGSSGSLSAVLTSSDSFPLFTQLYTGLVGSLSGTLTLDDTQPSTDVSGVDLDWFRPWINTQHYPQGWAGGLKIDLIGAKYVVPSGRRILPGITPASPTATLTFSDGQLTQPVGKRISVAKTIALTKAGTVENVPATDTSFSLMVTPETGAFSGSFTHTNGTMPTMVGYVLQKGVNARGFGRFRTTTPTPFDGTGEAGRVSLTYP